MAYEDCLVHVLETVLARDLPDEAVGQALANEAGLLCGEELQSD